MTSILVGVDFVISPWPGEDYVVVLTWSDSVQEVHHARTLYENTPYTYLVPATRTRVERHEFSDPDQAHHFAELNMRRLGK